MKKQFLIGCITTVLFVTGAGMMEGCRVRDSANKKSTQQDTTRQEQSKSDNKQSQKFKATLKGSSKDETEATGTVTVTLQEDSIHLLGKFSGLSSEYKASQLYKITEVKKERPIQLLEPTVGSNKTFGVWEATYSLKEEDIAALKAGNLYIEVQSSEYSSGEIHGQLVPD